MELMNVEKSNSSPERGSYTFNYERHLENNVLRSAITSGYFNTLTATQLLVQHEKRKKNRQLKSSYGDSLEVDLRPDGNQDGLDSITLLDLSSSKLRIVTAIGACLNLTVCDLSDNYLEKFDALRACKCLRKLDLHQNHIMELPDEEFWLELINLQVLYMHDNGVPSFAEVKKMSAVQNLLILTMYDTPVSLKQYYRHFIVNSIWSLKALDNVVLSDEEIIEDANFSKRFQAMQPQFFFISQSLESQENRTLNNEIKAIQMDITAINKIQAKFCPVLIIQKFTRGFLTRLRFHYEQDRRLWAAVTIQRYYRAYCGFEVPQDAAIEDQLSVFNMLSKPVDYDTYVTYRRIHQLHPVFAEDSQEKLSFKSASNRTVNVHIDLMEASMSKFVDDSSLLEASLSHKGKETKFQRFFSVKKNREFDVALLGKFDELALIGSHKKSRNRGGKKLRAIGSVKSKQIDERDEATDDADYSYISFRLEGLPAPKVESDMMEGLTKCIIEGARDIRETIREFEMERARIPRPMLQKSNPVTVDQKIFIRTHGTMSLSCFRAVDQAYKDRDRAKRLSATKQGNEIQKQSQEMMIKLREEKKNTSIEKQQEVNSEAKNELVQAMNMQKTERLARKESVALKRRERERKLLARKRGLALTVEFNSQANAIYKALGSHAAMVAKGRITEINRERNRNMREDIDRQKEIIRRYYEHRNLLLQSEISLNRSKLETDLRRRSIAVKEEAKLRVKKLKETHLDKEFAFPCISTLPPKLPPLAIVAETQLKTWENLPKKELKVREHDRVNIWLS